MVAMHWSVFPNPSCHHVVQAEALHCLTNMKPFHGFYSLLTGSGGESFGRSGITLQKEVGKLWMDE